MNHSEEMKLMYYHFAVALEKTSELVSLIKHPEHLKFVEAASSAVVQEHLRVSDTYIA